MTNIKIISKKLIKPCIPTPQNLKNYKLSFLDEISPQMQVGVVLFYPSKEKNSHLEESLAKILVQFYPLAGRFVENDLMVDCSDQGAQFVEAEAPDVELLDLIVERNLEKLHFLSPREAIDPLLSIQITSFKCGGVALAVSVPHRIFDASSLATFITAWSSAGKIIICPCFDAASWFPARNHQGKGRGIEASRSIVKKFPFKKEALASLRSISRVSRVSRVCAVTAVIARALIGLDRAKREGESRPSIIVQAVNIRERTIPPLPEHSCGNMVALSPTRCMDAAETMHAGIRELVCLLGDAIEKSISGYALLRSVDQEGMKGIVINPVADAYKKSVRGEANVMWFSDWSKFGFYEADFGWGKPAWTSIGEVPGENFVVLMNDKEGDGIEAWVNLDGNDMKLFEQDEEIGFFTT
ncbi:pelargonidin 3-O-(6-caffeoylglucoside) 5-O-(6-O-malonylglucoside) 4'''-malonyltransferase-like [Salvia miltiorrhiza]|uniref:pelargonidin 3-O-(6-caffeoylglucoside) 5-O-(6-O-malonylglucoside) 4'''-malonyltransferase-like n=1 Tax=Salvia miltiorrhiza TaxID=226208 RepID=UPI0025AC8930|nr:pelargonidin 3-O-(6-caffeoylglucoside) 5-O-(6-O-malonylglucoside) 4'''-malonyltransferase-like [Salvia miltiorrhiza]